MLGDVCHLSGSFVIILIFGVPSVSRWRALGCVLQCSSYVSSLPFRKASETVRRSLPSGSRVARPATSCENKRLTKQYPPLSFRSVLLVGIALKRGAQIWLAMLRAI